ncbi:MAG: type II toxin-antitoxin system YafQ family toxin [Candidatus Cryptobacteroides sp.]|nr:type II toxin-antitoxin system YafQ family toxin [Bacteroidales bacterium]
MYRIEQSRQFKKDLKKYLNDKKKLIALNNVIQNLEVTGTVPDNYKPHPLKGNYADTMECHIQSDFLLIWIDEENQVIRLVRIGTHSELFG